MLRTETRSPTTSVRGSTVNGPRSNHCETVAGGWMIAAAERDGTWTTFSLPVGHNVMSEAFDQLLEIALQFA